MKVLDLQCSRQHVFEGWFASEDDFQSQLARGLVSCPMCADTSVSKKLSAPRLNLSTPKHEANHPVTPSPASAEPPSEPSAASKSGQLSGTSEVSLQADLLKMVRHVVANTEDVGPNFTEEVRKMHYGDAEHRNIRGQATPQQTQALLEEGISVLPLPMADAVKETLQ